MSLWEFVFQSELFRQLWKIQRSQSSHFPTSYIHAHTCDTCRLVNKTKTSLPGLQEWRRKCSHCMYNVPQSRWNSLTSVFHVWGTQTAPFCFPKPPSPLRTVTGNKQLNFDHVRAKLCCVHGLERAAENDNKNSPATRRFYVIADTRTTDTWA